METGGAREDNDEGLCMRLFGADARSIRPRGREVDSDHGTALGRVLGDETSPVRLDDVTRDGEPQAGVPRFRREERLEDACAMRSFDADTIIADGESKRRELPEIC